MTSRSIEDSERTRVLMAFQKYLPHLLRIFNVFQNSFCRFSFTSSDCSKFFASVRLSLHPSENVLALYAFFNQRITHESFRPSLDLIKWLTDNIGPTASPASPQPAPVQPFEKSEFSCVFLGLPFKAPCCTVPAGCLPGTNCSQG